MENNDQSNKYNAIVIGATGAVGRELVDILLSSKNYTKITIFVRRIIDRWTKLTPEQSSKLNIVKVENLDFLGEPKEELEKRFEGTKYDVLFNGMFVKERLLGRLDNISTGLVNGTVGSLIYYSDTVAFFASSSVTFWRSCCSSRSLLFNASCRDLICSCSF